LAVLAVAEVVVLALTLHAHFTFHSNGGPNTPSVMSIGQLLGWFFSIAIPIVMVLIVGAARQSARYRGGSPPPRYRGGAQSGRDRGDIKR